MGQNSSRQESESTDEDARRESLRSALPALLEQRERLENLRRTLELQAALAQVNQQRAAASIRVARTRQITVRTTGDPGHEDLARLLALRAVISQVNDDSSASTSRIEASRGTAAQDSDSDDEESERAINALFALGDLARLVGELRYGEDAETILIAPQLGTRVGRKSDDEGNSLEAEAGTVVEVVSNLSFDVLWDKEERETFMVGCKNRTVVVLDYAPGGVQHPHISCNTCPESPNRVSGYRWKCMECYDFDMCTSCYMNNKHDTDHRFIRFDKENFHGFCVPPRSSSNEVVQSVGLFPGAIVQRGPDWKWGDQDGGAGSLGTILNFTEFSAARPRSGVTVQWRSSGSNSYRNGFEGKMDLKCARAAKGLSYYWDHLRKCSVEAQPLKPAFNYSQSVKCTLPVDLLEPLMEGNGEWDPFIAEFVGKNASVVGYMANNDVVVQYNAQAIGGTSTGRRFVWIFHPAALETSTSAVPSQPPSSGVTVQQTRPPAPRSTTSVSPPVASEPSTSGQSRVPAGSGPPTMCQSCDEQYASVTFHPCGHKLVCEVCSVHMKKCMTCKGSIESKTHVVIRKPVPAKQQTGDDTAGRQCEICMEKVKDTAFAPCGHGACSACAGHINQCHICRARIKSKIRTYF